GSGHE
ncbi:hypothetical protein MK338_11690, partial [Streptococcus vestibularis]